jgi:hypothetical protein
MVPAGDAEVASEGVLTRTVAVAVFAQAPQVILDVYVVVEEGVATGLLIFALLSPVVGDQV